MAMMLAARRSGVAAARHRGRFLSGPARAAVRPRQEIVASLEQTEEYDILVVGGGATGAGVALDAATRGLRVACVERGDFASETSSRSTKLIWAGSRYLFNVVTAICSTKMITNPIATVRARPPPAPRRAARHHATTPPRHRAIAPAPLRTPHPTPHLLRAQTKMCIDELKMVVGCARERKYMTEKNPHLTNWIPIALPFDSWTIWPPPMGSPVFSLLPIACRLNACK